MTNRIIIKLLSDDSRVLDDSVRKIVSTLDVETHVTIRRVVISTVRLLHRDITIAAPSKNTFKILEKIDIPQNVQIAVSLL